MIKAFYFLIACNLASAIMFFSMGFVAKNPLISSLGWIFVAATAMLTVFMLFMKRKYPKL